MNHEVTRNVLTACCLIAAGAMAPLTAHADEPGVAWTMAVIPDTQNYVKNAAYRPVLNQMTQWIADNRVNRNIGLVLHEGDLVERNDASDSTAQWQAIQSAMSTLDGKVPYILSTGNHDYGTTNAQNRDTQFNTYFKATDNALVDPAQGGILAGTMNSGELQNAYYEYKAPDGRDLLVFSLEWGPRQAAVDWAASIADNPEYADHTSILLTHAYMYHNDTRYDITKGGQSWSPYAYGTSGDTNDGEDLWNELVKLNGNFEMTFNGHVLRDGLAYLESTGDEGNSVHQMLFNTQTEANGGNGWIRLLEYLDDGKTVQVRTYSPFLDEWRTDAANEFTFELSEVPEPGTLTLSLLAMSGFALRRRRRRSV